MPPVQQPARFQDTVRALRRDRLLDAAAELICAQDWAKVRMADIADRAGVSRKTVYNEFGSKPELARALVLRNFQTYVARVDDVFTEHDDIAQAIGALVERTVRIAADDPLLQTYLSAGQGGPNQDLLAALTTETEPLLGAVAATATSRIHRHWPELNLPPDELDTVVDCIVRLIWSHILAPTTTPEDIGRRTTWIAQRLLSSAS